MKPTRFYSKQQERRVAREVNGVVVANSGATAFSKGDVRTDLFLIECKTATSEKQSIVIQKKWLTKLEDEAFAMRRQYYSLAFDFGGTDSYYIINSKTFNLLTDLLRMEEETSEGN